MSNIKLIDISQLKPHEQISHFRVLWIVIKIIFSKNFTKPILIDSKTKTILDGHHRFWAVKKLGLKQIPCLCINYIKDPSIRVYTRRPQIMINKKTVLTTALNGKVFPYKTTRHEYSMPTFEPLSIHQLASLL